MASREEDRLELLGHSRRQELENVVPGDRVMGVEVRNSRWSTLRVARHSWRRRNQPFNNGWTVDTVFMFSATVVRCGRLIVGLTSTRVE